MNKLIRLTEQDLHRIVKESVNRILRESSPLTASIEQTEEYKPFYDLDKIYASGWCEEQIDKLFKTFGRRWPEIIARKCGVSPEKYSEKELAIISNTNWMSRGRVIRDIQKYNEAHNTSF